MTGIEHSSLDGKRVAPDTELSDVAKFLHQYDAAVARPTQGMLRQAQEDLRSYGFPVVTLTNTENGKDVDLAMQNGDHYRLSPKGTLTDAATNKEVDPYMLVGKSADATQQSTNIGAENPGGSPPPQAGLNPEGLNSSLPPDAPPGFHSRDFGLNPTQSSGAGLGLSYKAYEFSYSRGIVGNQFSINRRIGDRFEGTLSYSTTTRTAWLGFRTDLGRLPSHE
jgi:hypothetical protein